MLMCYVDESGDTGLLVPTERNSQPIFLIFAVIVRQSSLKQLTRAIIDLKKRFFPSYGNGVDHWHDWLKYRSPEFRHCTPRKNMVLYAA